MARVTVEDCILKVPDRFQLVMMAGQRARDISAGASLTVDRDNDKNPVVALREIADETVDLDSLRDALVRGHQRHIEFEEAEEEVVELMAGEEEWPVQEGGARPSAIEPGPDDAEAESALGEDAGEGAEDPDGPAEDEVAEDALKAALDGDDLDPGDVGRDDDPLP